MSSTINLDQFYTAHHEVEKCLHLFSKHFSFSEFDKIVEPAAGDGAFFKYLPNEKRIGWDLEPRAEGITQLDFISDTLPFLNGTNIAVITNPPFGRKGSLAFKFIERSITFANVIGIVLPRIFAKDNYIKRWNVYYHLVDSINTDSFVSPTGELYQVRCVFQIWQKRDYKRNDVIHPSSHPDFIMKHAHMSRITHAEREAIIAEYPFAIGQVSCKFTNESSTITKGSYWFIKPLVKGVDNVFQSIDFAKLDDNYTTLKSLTKAEIVKAYKSKL